MTTFQVTDLTKPNSFFRAIVIVSEDVKIEAKDAWAKSFTYFAGLPLNVTTKKELAAIRRELKAAGAKEINRAKAEPKIEKEFEFDASAWV